MLSSVQYQHPKKNHHRHTVSVWKIDIVDNIVEQANSINSVFCVHLGYHRTIGTNPHPHTHAHAHTHAHTEWFWHEGASVLSSEFHVTVNVFSTSTNYWRHSFILISMQRRNKKGKVWHLWKYAYLAWRQRARLWPLKFTSSHIISNLIDNIWILWGHQRPTASMWL